MGRREVCRRAERKGEGGVEGRRGKRTGREGAEVGAGQV